MALPEQPGPQRSDKILMWCMAVAVAGVVAALPLIAKVSHEHSARHLVPVVRQLHGLVLAQHQEGNFSRLDDRILDQALVLADGRRMSANEAMERGGSLAHLSVFPLPGGRRFAILVTHATGEECRAFARAIPGAQVEINARPTGIPGARCLNANNLVRLSFGSRR